MRKGALLILLGVASSGCRSRANWSEPAQEVASTDQDAGDSLPAAPAVATVDVLRTWSSSADGDPSIVVSQTASSARDCTVEAKRADAPLWSMHQCVATIGDHRVVSPDGQALLVLDESPVVESYPTAAVVATLFDRGVRLRTLLAGELDPSGRGMRVESGRLAWLAPRPLKIDARGVTLALDNLQPATISWDGKRPALAKTAAPRQLSCKGGCTYLDASGVVQFVTSAEDIPDQYQASAKVVDAPVNVLSAPPLTRSAPSIPEPAFAPYTRTLRTRSPSTTSPPASQPTSQIYGLSSLPDVVTGALMGQPGGQIGTTVLPEQIQTQTATPPPVPANEPSDPQ